MSPAGLHSSGPQLAQLLQGLVWGCAPCLRSEQGQSLLHGERVTRGEAEVEGEVGEEGSRGMWETRRLNGSGAGGGAEVEAEEGQAQAACPLFDFPILPAPCSGGEDELKITL